MDFINLPDAFCWTKMGTESGESVRLILTLKESQRKLGEGIFFWGIGTALGNRIWKLVDSVKPALVLFSPMKSKPKQIDVHPDVVVDWKTYIDRCGVRHAIPSYARVTSRGSSSISIKTRHYALVCRKTSPLLDDQWPVVDMARMRNYDGGARLGYSQITAIVEYDNPNMPVSQPEINYPVLFGAELVHPYYVILTDPVQI